MFRVKRWDAELDRQKRLAIAQAQIEAAERHANTAHAALEVLTMPIRILRERHNQPGYVTTLQGADDATLLREVYRASTAISSLSNMERLALGMSQTWVQPNPMAEPDMDFANRITDDPAATDLAIALLNRIHRPPD